MSLERESRRRRTFAIISHPDAGKTTITESFYSIQALFTWPAPLSPAKPHVILLVIG